jgi:aspartate/methionine/tyrosine aminotransferase
VAPFYVMEVAKAAADRQRTHGDVIGLFVGQPATPAPAIVRERAAQAVTDEVLGYTVTNGIPALREAIAAEYQRRYQVRVDPGQVMITTGSSAGFVLAALASVDVGDRVAMASPGYPAYRNTLRALGAEVVSLRTGAATRFQPSTELLRELADVPKAVVVASPSNPTGTIIAPAELARISAWCDEVGCRLISDEIYHEISFGRDCASAWQFGSNSLVVGSVSKYHSMTGWRLGWLLVPDDLVDAVERLQANLAICAPAVSQAAAVAAFTPQARAELEGHVARYARNREVLLRRLPELGIDSFAPPDGAFYAYCDVSHLTDDSLVWCEDVLAATGVALAPGIDFDEDEGRRMIRLSFCGETDELNEALDRLQAYLER